MKADAATNPQPSTAPKADPSAASRRVYQVWKGSNIFFLYGRLIFGPDVQSLMLTILLILGPAIVFCLFVARPLLDEFPHHSGDAIMVVAVVFTAYDLTLLLLTSARDPGIIPRNTHPPEPEPDDYDICSSSSDWGGVKTPKLRLPRTKTVIVNGVAVKVKYCDTCMLYRPPRCSHCSICNNCVERFDHHCPWVGQCIGRRNYPFFFMFILSTMLLCIYVFSLSALHIKRTLDKDSNSVWRTLGKCPAAVFLMGYTFIAVWFVGGLSFFHIYLLSTNQTTYENFRYQYDNRLNPYNFGIFHNVKEIFCTAIPPSQNKFHAKVQLESSDTVESRDVSHSNKTDQQDIEMGGKSVVGGETLMSLYRLSNDGNGMDIDNYEDSFTRALGFPFPYEGDCRVVTLARHSGCGGAESLSCDTKGSIYALAGPDSSCASGECPSIK